MYLLKSLLFTKGPFAQMPPLLLAGPCTHIAKGEILSETQRHKIAEVFAHHGGKVSRPGQLLQALAAIEERWSKQEVKTWNPCS